MDTHLDTSESLKMLWGISDICDGFINVGFLRDFANFVYDKCKKNIQSLDFYLEYVLW